MQPSTLKIAIAAFYAAICIVGSRPVYAYDCFDAAAAYHHVDVTVLRAIAIQENRRCDGTVRRNTNRSIDVGCMQINSVHFQELSKWDISPDDLKEPCRNVFVGAWLYRQAIDKHGNNWEAVGAYHSETPALKSDYAWSVYRIWRRMTDSQ